jgi:3-oxoacyl-[acyl-carrier protein] reductase
VSNASEPAADVTAGAHLAGKVVVVTGSGQGLGRAYARGVVAAGATVVLADVNEDAGRTVAGELTGDGGHAIFYPLDVAEPDSCARFAEAVWDAHGRVDGLVNNAAIFSTIEMRSFWEIPVREWDRLMAVNLRGPWLLTSALLPALRVSAAASIVNVASDAVWLGRPGYLHYIASKAGLAGMTHSMAHELGGEGIRVNTVSPGPIYTEVPRGTVSPEQKERMLAAQSLHREGHPEDMVGAVIYLLSAGSRWVTGHTMHVNGGLLHR